MHDGYVSVSVIAVTHTTHSAHDVFEAAELGAKASNVNVVQELVAMIETQRAYEINSKMVSAVDEMLRNANQTL